MRDHAVAARDAVSRGDAGDMNDRRTSPTDFERLAARAISRRGFLCGTAACGATAFVLSAGGLRRSPRALRWRASISRPSPPTASTRLPYPTATAGMWWPAGAIRSGRQAPPSTMRVAAPAKARRPPSATTTTAWRCTDGDKNVLAVNNEYVNLDIMFANRESGKPETADDVRKCKAGHGVSVIEIAQQDGAWRIVQDSPYNRRITPDTPMEITGPARGHDLVKTATDPAGTIALGTWNNCGNGRTPWGTYLACEENFNGYFSSSDPDFALPAGYKRYGIKAEDRGYGWAMTDERFDVSKHPNEPNRAGYVVEIDPLDPASMPKKRTALGRFKHENAEVTLAADGRVVVYLGDDERGEFLYKFVSDGVYAEGGDNRDLLESGTLSVARFADDGTGEWVALTPESTGMASQAEICIHTRQAASAVGATTMDRPEWVAANPNKAEAYCCLTNNKNRGVKPNAGGDLTPVGGPNPREKNKYGQIVRWMPDGGDHASATFAWDLYVIAGNPTVHGDARAGSANVNADNMFNSPDGIAFDSQGRLWIQTDGKYSNEGDFAGQGNNMMLVGDPATGEIRRFLVGPRECEVTGITWSADRKTMFIGIQHPGEKGDSHFPEGGEATPRSAVVAITRDDGGVIG